MCEQTLCGIICEQAKRVSNFRSVGKYIKQQHKVRKIEQNAAYHQNGIDSVSFTNKIRYSLSDHEGNNKRVYQADYFHQQRAEIKNRNQCNYHSGCSKNYNARNDIRCFKFCKPAIRRKIEYMTYGKYKRARNKADIQHNICDHAEQ